MFSLELLTNNKLENGSKILTPYYWEKDAVIKFKQKLIRAKKFVVGSEFFYFTEALENLTYGKEYGNNLYIEMAKADMAKVKNEFLNNPKRLAKLKENWKFFCRELPFDEIFFESEKNGFLLERGPDGVIFVYEVKETGLLTPVKFTLNPDSLDIFNHDQILAGAIRTDYCKERNKALNDFHGFDVIALFSNLIAIQLYQLLMFINCKNINIIYYKPKKSELSKIPKVLQKGFEYHIVKLSETTTRYESLTDIENDLKRHLPKEIKEHVVRGHFKRRSTGVFWWNSFLRGHRKNGVIEKHYEVA